jgi:hypothetical protein
MEVSAEAGGVDIGRREDGKTGRREDGKTGRREDGKTGRREDGGEKGAVEAARRARSILRLDVPDGPEQPQACKGIGAAA